jgi:deoxycytidine triphosphate deaminase
LGRLNVLIVGKRIIDDNLLLDADEKQIKNASYYLTIDAIIPAGPKAEEYDPSQPTRHYTMRPREIAWVVSKERFNIKTYDVTALVTLRSTFTKKGLLALDVGLVDPDYEGPIGSIVINFSKNNIPLNQGDPFFRVIFISHPSVKEYRRTGIKY